MDVILPDDKHNTLKKLDIRFLQPGSSSVVAHVISFRRKKENAMMARPWEDVMGGNSVIKRRRGFQQSPGGVHAAEKAWEGGWGVSSGCRRAAASMSAQLRRVMVVAGIAVG